MKVYIEFTRENLTYVIERARIGYWVTSMQRVRPLTYRINPHAGPAYELTPAKIEEGIQLMARTCPYVLAGLLDSWKCDETTGDVLIQYALFGEMRYARPLDKESRR